MRISMILNVYYTKNKQEITGRKCSCWMRNDLVFIFFLLTKSNKKKKNLLNSKIVSSSTINVLFINLENVTKILSF